MSAESISRDRPLPAWVVEQIVLFTAATGVEVRFSRMGEMKLLDACRLYRSGDRHCQRACENWHDCQAQSFHACDGAAKFHCPMRLEYLWAPVSYGGFLYGFLCTQPARRSGVVDGHDGKEAGLPEADSKMQGRINRRLTAMQRVLRVKSPQRDGLLLLLELFAQRLGARFYKETRVPLPVDPQELLVRRAEAILCCHYHEDISTCDISSELNVSESHLCHAFQAVTRGTLRQHLNELRFKEACRLLKERPHLTVAEVAFAAGFQSLSRFSEQFRRRKLPSPGRWRQTDA